MPLVAADGGIIGNGTAASPLALAGGALPASATLAGSQVIGAVSSALAAGYAADAGNADSLGGLAAGNYLTVSAADREFIQASSELTCQGPGTAGAPAGGVLTVQGTPGATPIPVSASISGSISSVSTGPDAPGSTPVSNPLQLGAVAVPPGTAPQAAAAAGDVTRLYADTQGRLFVAIDHPDLFFCFGEGSTVSPASMGCTFPSASLDLALYITDVHLMDSSGVGGSILSSAGTGATCATSSFLVAEALGSGLIDRALDFRTPIRIPPGYQLCGNDNTSSRNWEISSMDISRLEALSQ